jgi:geranylgeranyl diphosphate synthase type II
MRLQSWRADLNPDEADLATIRATVDRRLSALAPAESRRDGLNQAVRSALTAPGKRIRPLLTLLACDELGQEDLSALDAGCALEMVHAASLVLDDLPAMDDAKWRRGRPATHVAFGEDVAILAAVSLLGRAFSTLAACRSLAADVRGRLVAILAEAVGPDGLAGGQYEDLRGGERVRAVDRILDANHLKTGVLFVTAIEMAITVADAKREAADRLRRFAHHLGQAFQLLDDLHDSNPGGGQGEPVEDAGKVTLVSLLGPEEVERRIAAHVTSGLADLRPGGLLATFVRSIFERARDDAAGRLAVGA